MKLNSLFAGWLHNLRKLTPCLIFIAVLSGFKAFSQPVKISFIGNCAFKIQLDTLLVFSDFPYKSGAYGYMTYTLDSVYHGERGIALITHKHNDHFSGKEFSKTKLKRVGPKVSQKQLEKLAKNYGLTVKPIKTRHRWSIKHRSYSVQWRNRRIYFTGDTEGYDKLIEEKDFDILFITPWLLDKLQKDNLKLKARTIILYHHDDSQETYRKENAAICDCELIAPAQNDAYSL